MKASGSAFTFRFRAPGSPAQGPIRFALGQSSGGLVLVGRSPRGICAIQLGEDAQGLQDELAQAFPGMELQPDAGLEHELHQIAAFIDNGVAQDLIHLDVGGTAFEQKVWRALCAIPAGQLRSDGEIGQEIGMPQAARAVAGACAANRLAVLIPCHRVVRTDRRESGYRWGVGRRHALRVAEHG